MEAKSSSIGHDEKAFLRKRILSGIGLTNGDEIYMEKSKVNDPREKDGIKGHTQFHSMVFRHIIPDIILGYVTWCLMHGLAPLIWFYPLNELELSGYEVFAVSFLSPAILAIPPLKRFLQRDGGLAFLRFVMVLGVSSFRAKTSYTRLAMLSAGTAAALVLLTLCLWSTNAFKRCISYWALMLSYLFYLGTRVWYDTLVPTWSDEASNAVVIALCAIAAVDRSLATYDDSHLKEGAEMSSKSTSCMSFAEEGETQNNTEYKQSSRAPDLKSAQPPKVPQKSAESAQSRSLSEETEASSPLWTLVVGFGLGCWLYLVHALFGEVSVVLRWVGKSYPSTGPRPDLAGVFVYLSLAFGLLLGCAVPAFTTSFIWWSVGVTGTVGVYMLNRKMGLFAGCLLGAYVVSVSSILLSRAARHPHHVTMVTAWVTYVAAMFFSIWTVAYNFVPLGEYTRERTHLLLATCLLGLGAALVLYPKSRREEFFVMSSTGYLDVPAFGKIYISLLWLAAVALGLSGFIARIGVVKPAPKKAPEVFTAAIWTFHFGYDNDGWPNFERAAWLLNETGVHLLPKLKYLTFVSVILPLIYLLDYYH